MKTRIIVRQERFPLPPGTEAKVRDAVTMLPSKASSTQIHSATEKIMDEIDSIIIGHYVRIYEMIVESLKALDTTIYLPRGRFFNSADAFAHVQARQEEEAPVIEIPSVPEPEQTAPPPTQLPDGQFAFGGF
ncbi:MAG: hypothetical protein Q8L64_04945 [bacterium]|nr:hypothetical protein [bacterium]